MKRKIAWTMQCLALFFSVNIYAKDYQSTVLYPGNGNVLTEFTTFPELPEWRTNWGNQGGLEPPYIRFSGQKDFSSDWETRLEFSNFPEKLSAGILELSVYSDKNSEVEIGIQNSEKKTTHLLQAGISKNIQIPLETFFAKFPVRASYLTLSLKNVPARQYQTFLLGNVRLLQNANSESALVVPYKSNVYLPSNTDFRNSARLSMEDFHHYDYPKNAYSKEEKDSLKLIAESKIFLQEMEYAKIESMSLDSAYSVSNFISKVHRLSRGFLEDSVFANPKTLWNFGKKLAASYDYSVLPIMAADINYQSAECESLANDSTCSKYRVVQRHFLEAAPVLGFVKGSKVQFVSDPYFWIVSSGTENFVIELIIDGKNYVMEGAKVVEVEFSQLGTHEIKIRTRRGTESTERKYLLEVK